MLKNDGFFQDIFIAASPDLLVFLESLLLLDPNRRLTAKQALKHEYFATKPYPSPGSALPMPGGGGGEEGPGDPEGGDPGASRAGLKRKRPGLEGSGLAKRLVF